MSRLLELQPGIIYGPIDSRRLGSSLGINLLPSGYKACPFNCAYCQYGFTRRNGYLSSSDGRDLPGVDEVGPALEKALDKSPKVAYITFSGNGEPTLHPRFEEIVDRVAEIRDRQAPESRLAILSNSAFVTDPAVWRALGRLDERFMKLDAGDERTFRRFNRPRPDIDYEAVVAGLAAMADIVLQALFAGGPGGNYDNAHIDRWLAQVARINPRQCHIYSIERPALDNQLTLIDRSGLLRIQDRARRKISVPIRVFANP